MAEGRESGWPKTAYVTYHPDDRELEAIADSAKDRYSVKVVPEFLLRDREALIERVRGWGEKWTRWPAKTPEGMMYQAAAREVLSLLNESDPPRGPTQLRPMDDPWRDDDEAQALVDAIHGEGEAGAANPDPVRADEPPERCSCELEYQEPRWISDPNCPIHGEGTGR